MQALQSRTSLMMMGLLAATLSVSACQKSADSESQSSKDTTTEEPAVPMSAEPAEPHDTVVTESVDEPTDPNASEVANDTVATVETGAAAQMSYACTPALKLDVTYNADAKNVIVNTDQGSVSLDEIGEGSYEAAKSLDGGEGLTQWRVADDHHESGVLRVSMGGGDKVTAYECKAGGQ